MTTTEVQLNLILEIAVSISRMLPGISGAPAVDTKGRLVGLVRAFDQKTAVTYLVPAIEIAAALAGRPRRA